MTAPAASNRNELYGQLVFGVVVLVAFADMLRVHWVSGEPWQVVVVYLLAAFYVAIGVFGMVDRGPCSPARRVFFFVTECALFTAMAFLNPLQGFFGLAAMPLASMAVLDLRRRWAAVVVLHLWATCVGAIWFTFGAANGLSSILSYAAAFIFTVLFSLVTRSAMEAKQRAEQLSSELSAANEQLRRFAEQAGELATTRERNRLAREIHDGLGHYLTIINVQLEAAGAVIAREPERAVIALDTAVRLSREALDDVRRSVGTLRADTPRPPLPEAVQALALNLGLSVEVEIRGTPRPLSPAVEHALYRASQEGLTNVLKHAGARHTRLTLDYADAARLVLTVADDGRGAVPDATAAGFGLRGIRERLDLLGGKVTAGPAPHGGFVLTVEVPASSHPAS